MIFKECNTKERGSSYGTGRNILWNNSLDSDWSREVQTSFVKY